MAVVKPDTPAPTITVSRTAFSSTAAVADDPGTAGAAVAAIRRWMFLGDAFLHAISFVPVKEALEPAMRRIFPLADGIIFGVRPALR